jgi:hypothetical protein
MTKASIKRWLDDMGAHLPGQQEMLQPWLARTPATACHSDGSYPRGTANGVRVGQEEPERILLTPEAASAHGEAAKPLLQQLTDLGLKVTAAGSAYSQSCTAALTAVSPQARWHADHFHTGKQSWGHLKTSLVSSRRRSKAHGDAKNDQACLELAKTLGQWRWSLLKKPTNVSAEAKQAIAALASQEEGFVHRFRSLLRQLGPIVDYAHRAAQAKRRLLQLRQASRAVHDAHLAKMLTFLADHGEQALRYRRKKGMGTHRRSSNSEAGMRRLRRLEKNHDGIRSAATRPHYIQIYQAIKYLSLDIAEFIEKGPQMTGLPRV